MSTPQDKESWRRGACRGGLSWPARLSGWAASLECTVRIIRHGSDPERQVGGLPCVPGGRAPGYVGLGTKTAAQAGWQAALLPAQGACWAFLHTSQARQRSRVYTPINTILFNELVTNNHEPIICNKEPSKCVVIFNYIDRKYYIVRTFRKAT
jgi:hypothetical protein